jgi:hypothetical protein
MEHMGYTGNHCHKGMFEIDDLLGLSQWSLWSLGNSHEITMKSPIPRSPHAWPARAAQVVLSPPELASHLATATARAKLGGETQHWDTGAMAGPVGRSLGFFVGNQTFLVGGLEHELYITHILGIIIPIHWPMYAAQWMKRLCLSQMGQT